MVTYSKRLRKPEQKQLFLNFVLPKTTKNYDKRPGSTQWHIGHYTCTLTLSKYSLYPLLLLICVIEKCRNNLLQCIFNVVPEVKDTSPMHITSTNNFS